MSKIVTTKDIDINKCIEHKQKQKNLNQIVE